MNNKTKAINKIAITIGVLFALALSFALGGSYATLANKDNNKDFEEYSSYVIKEEERLQTSEEEKYTQLPQHYQDEQINKIPKSLTGKQEQLAYMLAYGLSNDYQDNWLNAN